MHLYQWRKGWAQRLVPTGWIRQCPVSSVVSSLYFSSFREMHLVVRILCSRFRWSYSTVFILLETRSGNIPKPASYNFRVENTSTLWRRDTPRLWDHRNACLFGKFSRRLGEIWVSLSLLHYILSSLNLPSNKILRRNQNETGCRDRTGTPQGKRSWFWMKIYEMLASPFLGCWPHRKTKQTAPCRLSWPPVDILPKVSVLDDRLARFGAVCLRSRDFCRVVVLKFAAAWYFPPEMTITEQNSICWENDFRD